MIKSIFMGILAVIYCALLSFNVPLIVIVYVDSFKAVGIAAIGLFLLATVLLALLLGVFWLIGEEIRCVQERNRKNAEVSCTSTKN